MEHQITISADTFKRIVSGQKKFWFASPRNGWNDRDIIAFVERTFDGLGLTGNVFHVCISYSEPHVDRHTSNPYVLHYFDPHRPGRESPPPCKCSCATEFEKSS